MKVRQRQPKKMNNKSSMSATANSAALVNPRIRPRWACTTLDQLSKSQQALSQSQTPAMIGSQFTAKTLVFSAADLSPNFQDWIQTSDCYRISAIEVYAVLTTNYTGTSGYTSHPVTHYCFEDPDTDPAVQTSWIRIRDRENLSRVVLRANQPAQLVATIKPRPSFISTGDQNPGNMIGPKDSWLDSLNLAQEYSGLRAYSYCPTADSSGQTYTYAINYQIRMKVECKIPI